MPLEKGSCLNEELTKQVEQIYVLLKEAKEKYEALPACLRYVDTVHKKHGGNTLGWYLLNGETCALCFAEEFGIEVAQ